MLEKLKELFPELEFKQSQIMGAPCYHGYVLVTPKTEVINKQRITYGNVMLFISSELYPNTPESFFYGMIYQELSVKEYRKVNAREVEAHKVFVSNKDVNVLVAELAEQTNMELYKF